MNIYKKLKIKKPTERQLELFVNTISILAIIGIVVGMWRDGWQTEIKTALVYFGIIAFCLTVGLWEKCGIEVYRALMVVPKGIGYLFKSRRRK